MTYDSVPVQSDWRFQRKTSGIGGTVVLERQPKPSGQTAEQSRAVRTAVLGYIKALRSLGNTRVNTRDISEALGLRQAIVEQAIAELQGEGVKVIK